MKRLRSYTLFLLFCAFAALPAMAKDRRAVSDQEIKQGIVEDSIASYPGRCPCPYNVTRNGSSCGGRSAWSRRGGYAPICYEREVTKEMVSRRKEQDRHRSEAEPFSLR